MNEQPYFHWDLLRQPIQPPSFGMGASFFDVNSILELRKEKSRDAARSRRGKENYEFYELAKLLPLPAAITSQLDKASIIRLSISYLKLRDFSGHGDPPWNRDPQHKAVKGTHPRRRSHPSISVDLFESHQGTHILQSLDGFAFILGNDGRFLYISETVSIYLGLSQVEMAGSSIFDYVHQQDHPELAEHLGLGVPQASSSGVPSPGSSEEGSPTSQRCVTPPGPDNRGYTMNPSPKQGCDRSFCLRMKSTLTKRGVHVKSSGYRVVHVLGQLRPQMSLGLGRKGGSALLGLVGVAIALPPPTITELRLEHDTFITRMSPDFQLTYCEPLISEHMDLTPDDVTNRSLYDLCHAGDLSHLRQAHVDVLGKGQVMTDYYRLLTRGGGYIWIQTCATTLLNGKNAEDQNILAINYILSGVEKSHTVMNLWQMCGTDTPVSSCTQSSSSASLFGGKAAGARRVASQDKEEESTPAADDDSTLCELSSTEAGLKNHVNLSSPSRSSYNFHGNADIDNDVMSDDSADTATGAGQGNSAEKSEGSSLDCKNSRRKMERPRKRKREEMESGEGDALPDSPSSASAPETVARKNRRKDLGEGVQAEARSTDTCNALSSPEDLSLKSSVSLDTGHALSSDQHTLTSPVLNTCQTVSNSQTGHWQCTVTSSSQASGGCVSVVTPSTVKELEAVMNRHLPFMDTGPLHSDATSPTRLHGTQMRASNGNPGANFPVQANKKSTIQWVGGSQSASSSSSSEAMAASSFLRSLYENRESVIRSCNSSSNGSHNLNVKGNACNHHGDQRPNQLYEDISGTLLTPPGTDVFRDHPPPFSIPSIVISSVSSHPSSSSPLSSSSASKQVPSYGGQLSRGYPSGALSLTLPCGGLGDTYGMTPPSSVSPQDKMPPSFAAAAAALSYNESSAHNSCGALNRTALHAASSPSSLVAKEASLGCHPVGGGHNSDYASAKAAYYAMSALSGAHGSGHGSGYADVNHNTTAAYDQCARPVIPWY